MYCRVCGKEVDEETVVCKTVVFLPVTIQKKSLVKVTGCTHGAFSPFLHHLSE